MANVLFSIRDKTEIDCQYADAQKSFQKRNFP